MAKTRDDFSSDALRGFHVRLTKATTREERDAIFKEMDAKAQAVGQWFRALKLAPLGTLAPQKSAKKAGKTATAKTTGGGKKRGRPRKLDLLKTKNSGKSAAKKAGPGRKKGKKAVAKTAKRAASAVPKGKTKRKPGRPKGSKNKVASQGALEVLTKAGRQGGLGLSKEAKEALILLLARVLAD